MRLILPVLALMVSLFLSCSRPVLKTAVQSDPPAFSSIIEEDLRRDLYFLAGDTMKGKRAGTLDELRAAAWLAEQARKAGLQPAGADGTWFQFFNIRRYKTGEDSRISIGGKEIVLLKDGFLTTPVESNAEGPVTWLQSLSDTSAVYLEGKIVAMDLRAPVPLPVQEMSLWGYRYTLTAIRQQTLALKNLGASAIILIADSIALSQFDFLGTGYKEGIYQLEGTPITPLITPAPVLLVHPRLRSDFRLPSSIFSVRLELERFLFPSVNVIGTVNGTDPLLKEEYVLFSGHHDHEGIGPSVQGDSIRNGADDNGSVCVSMLAIARAWAKNPGRRPALFVWHGAEERGLFGSRWFAERPTVKKESIIAVLNGDMIGRNDPDSAALLGVIPPHRNSAALVEMAMEANRRFTHFKIDTTWDSPRHPENWYFRSDHLSYARAGIPAIFYSTLLHPDYHTPRDEPAKIDYVKLARMTRWMYATGWLISNALQRPALDPVAKP